MAPRNETRVPECANVRRDRALVGRKLLRHDERLRAAGIVRPAGTLVATLGKIVHALAEHAAGLEQVGGSHLLAAHGVVAPAAEMGFVRFLDIAADARDVVLRRSVRGNVPVELGEELGGAERVRAALALSERGT